MDETKPAREVRLGEGAAYLWRPLPFLRIVRELGPTGRRIYWLLLVWLTAVLSSIALGIIQVEQAWNALPVRLGPAEVFITIYPPLFITTSLVFWLGFVWAFIPAYLATFTLSLYAGLDVSWAFLFAFADPLALAFYALVYRAAPIRIDLRTLGSLFWFLAASLIGALAGSAASFIWSAAQRLDAGETFAIWQGWWIGGFLQAALINAPVLYLLTPRVERLKFRTFYVPPRPKVSLARLTTAVLAGAALLMAFVWMMNEHADHLLAVALATDVPADAEEIVTTAAQSRALVTWTATALVVAVALGGILLAHRWSGALVEEVRTRTAEVRESRERLHRVLEIDPTAILTLDGEERLTYANAAAEDLIGLPRERIMRRAFDDPAWQITTPDGAPIPSEELPAMRALRLGRTERDVEIAFTRPDGRRPVVSVSAAPLRGPAGAITGVVVSMADITERLLVERALRLLAEVSSALSATLDYRAALRSLARLAVPRMADWCVVDLLERGRIRQITVETAEPAVEAPLREALAGYPSDPASARSPVAKVIRTGEPELITEVTGSELAGMAQDAKQLELLRRLAPRSFMIVPITADGETLGAITFASAESGRRFDADDLSFAEEIAHRAALAIDNAQLYERAAAASRAKSDFLAVMSHELRTPLNAIMGYTDLLEAEIPGPLTEPQMQQLERIEASAQHLLRLIQEILTFSRMEAGRERLQIAPVELSELVREATATVEPLAREKGLRLEVHAPEEPVRMETDRGKVRQILFNLLSNAVKFTERGEVELSVRVRDGTVEFDIRDTGIGIAPEDLARIFEPFQQVEEAMTREKGGTGLGLTVAQRLARLLGGDISVASKPGQGSTFTVVLPIRTRAAAPPADSRQPKGR